MKRFELKKKDWLDSSVFRIALVESPAIETDFIFLSKEDKPIQLSVQDEKRMIYSPVLIPDKIIPRVSDAGDPYEIYFSGDTIEEIAKDYMLKKVTLGEWNSEHNENQKLEGVDVVENWIVQNPLNDKATELGFKVPAKTWMQGTYISNDEVWAKIKDGTYKGISVEADMNHELTQLNKSEMSNTNLKLDAILTKLGEMIPQDEEGILICNNNACGKFVTYIIDSSKPNNKDPPNEVSYTAYIRLNHFKEILSQFQAKETTQIPEEVIDAIKARIKKERITDLTQLNYDKMRELLRKLGLNKYFEHIQYINSLLILKRESISLYRLPSVCISLG